MHRYPSTFTHRIDERLEPEGFGRRQVLSAAFLAVLLGAHLAAAYAMTPAGEQHRLSPF